MSGLPVRTAWVRQNDIDVLLVGEVEVGRVHANARSWLFSLKHPSFWRGERSAELARTALIAAFSDWLKRAGLDQQQGDLFA